MKKPLGNTRASYQLRVRDGNHIAFDSGEFCNLIMNAALDEADPFSGGFLIVGDGVTAASVSDTSLENQISQTAATFEIEGSIFLDDNVRYGKRSVSGSFTGISGDISEVGFKNGAGDLLSRTLVRDGNGNLTKIPIQSHQTLDVIYYVYTQIPDILDSGVLSTAYGDTVDYTVKPSDEISSPAGIFVGRYDAPFGSSAANAVRLNLHPSGSVLSNSFSATFDSETQKTQVIINWPAVGENREILGFEAANNPESYPVVSLAESITLPEDNDLTLTLEFTRE
jgi:hypothetical protein